MEDLTGLGRATEKLLDVIARGCGVLYQPRAIRSEAKARAEEVRLLGAATNEKEVEKARLLARAEAERRVLLADADEEILERAQARLVHREVQRQKNIDAICDAAFQALPAEVSETPVGPDWVRRFFNNAEDVTEEAMQALWAKILAGEVTNPGSFSLRTLNVVRDLTFREAELFSIACRLSFDDGALLQQPSTTSNFRGHWLNRFGLSYEGLLALQDAGLIHDAEARAPFAAVKMSPSASEKHASLAFTYYGRVVRLTTLNPSSFLEFTVIPFTTPGRQLSKFVDREEVDGFLAFAAAEYGCSVDVISDMRSAAGRASSP